jgi:uncharacterized protein YdhG (YjbR/CyaY superfamily)
VGSKNEQIFLAAAPKEVRTKLKQYVRRSRKQQPNATEYISYGRPFIGFAAMKNHIGLYPMSGSFVAAHKNELEVYSTSKGAIQRPLDKALPLGLVKRIVKLRLTESKQL